MEALMRLNDAAWKAYWWLLAREKSGLECSGFFVACWRVVTGVMCRKRWWNMRFWLEFWYLIIIFDTVRKSVENDDVIWNLTMIFDISSSFSTLATHTHTRTHMNPNKNRGRIARTSVNPIIQNQFQS
jgi:hypothetical protein